jgi:hypothetical protein
MLLMGHLEGLTEAGFRLLVRGRRPHRRSLIDLN